MQMQIPGTADSSDNHRSLADLSFHSNLLNFNKRRPKFLEPGTWLPGEFQNLFDLCYLSGSGKELIPTGWNVLDEDKAYPRLASRNPQVSQNADELDDDFEMTNGRAASHSSNEDSDSRIGTLSGTTRMVDEEESDEDELASGPAKVSWHQHSLRHIPL